MRNFICGLSISVMVVPGFSACNKNNAPAQTSSTFTVVNAIMGNETLFANFAAGTPLIKDSLAQQVAPDGYFSFLGYRGAFRLSFTSLADTAHPVYQGSVTIQPASINTLYLFGPIANVDSLFMTEHIPVLTANLADSVIGVRIVNLSAGTGKGISVNIAGQSGFDLVSNLNYKGVSDFIRLPAASHSVPDGNYSFEFRDADTGLLLATAADINAYPVRLFKCVTLVLKGVPDGTGDSAPEVVLVNNY